MELKIEYIPIGELKTYANNAKIHTAEQIEQIKKSIEEFGMNDPIAVWKNNEIIEGHGRLIALQELGHDTVPIIRLDGLTDEQRKAYMLVHNKLTMNTDFDMLALEEELDKLSNIDMDAYGFGSMMEELDSFFEDEQNIPIPEPKEEPVEQHKVIVELQYASELKVLRMFLDKQGMNYSVD